ncbi:MAG: histidine phosphatase family protein [Deltaproteobacteria bacterium]|nr:histidine phosphatase family protein [Deltaproteobacteria bacterium]
MGDLYVVRHAQASFGKPDYDQLSELGFRQAGLLTEFLAQTGLRFEALYSGEMKRHLDTAQALVPRLNPDAAGAGLRIRAEFNEFDLAAVVNFQLPLLIRENPQLGQDMEALFTDPRALYRILNLSISRWINNPEGLAGVETWPAFTQRVWGGLEQIIRESGRGRTVALVTSGGPLAALLQKALNIPDLSAIDLAWQIRNASVSTFKFSVDRFSLASFNSVAHLEIRRDPALVTYR